MLMAVSKPTRREQAVMSIKHVAAATAAVAFVGFGAFASALTSSESAATSTTPEMASVHSWGELFASAPQDEINR
jgi:hypothetical protein